MSALKGEGEVAPRRVTSKDVAREAGLSRATVSYVLNRDLRQSIPEPTRQRVLDAAAKLGYKPYGPARILRGARSSIVLMLTPGLEHATDFVAAGIIAQLGEALSARGLHLVWQLGDTDQYGAAMDLAPTVVLSSAEETDETYSDLQSQFSVPIMPAFPGLDVFIASGASAQVEHLADRGRTSLVYVGPDLLDLKPTSETRWRAVLSTAEQLGLPRPLRIDMSVDRPTAARQFAALLADNPSIDGACAFNDEVAFGVLAAAHDLGIAVPGRVAVIGVDDHPFGPVAVPALSTVHSDVREFVQAFAESIVQIGRGQEGASVVLPDRAQVIARASS